VVLRMIFRFLITFWMIGLLLPSQCVFNSLPTAPASSRQAGVPNSAALTPGNDRALFSTASDGPENSPAEVSAQLLALGTWPITHEAEAELPRLRQPIPDRLVVLTFDDAPVTQAVFAAPILHKYEFGATFYICEFPPNFNDKTKYMSWKQVQQLDRMGFEIGNHTAFHTHVSRMSREQFHESLAYIEDKCKAYGIRKPVTFAYPGYDARSKDLDVLTERGYVFARIGGERAYDPLSDNPLLVPGFNANGTDPVRVFDAIKQARDGKVVVLIFHGIPDYEHPWVTTPPQLFAQYMEFLHKNRYKVIAMRDLTKYIGPDAPEQDTLRNSPLVGKQR
jgi:peptidoglycan/xylan/chitin deacetylase (PgdA/CDA1 family)